MPTRRSRRHVQAREIVLLMARTAFDAVDAMTVISAANLHGVTMAVITLARKVSGGMTIHTARVAKHRNNCFEICSGADIVARHDFTSELCISMFCSLSGNP